jgi:uncharacterized protein (TIGR01244 family)
MLRRALAVLPVLGLLATVASASAQRVVGSGAAATVPIPVVLEHAARYQARVASVGEDLLIAGQPTAETLRQLRRDGVTTVINLRMPDEMQRISFDEAALLQELGMEYVHLPVRGGTANPYSRETLRRFAETMKSANGKVLLHCTIAWRASHLWAAYLIDYRNMPVDTALAHARLINLMDDMRHGESGRFPVEDFLGRDLPELHRTARPAP